MKYQGNIERTRAWRLGEMLVDPGMEFLLFIYVIPVTLFFAVIGLVLWLG